MDKETSDGFCILCIPAILVIGCAACLVLIGVSVGMTYQASKLDSVREHHFKCDKPFNATVEAIANSKVKIIVDGVIYFIYSLPKFNISIGSVASVYSSCKYTDCENGKHINYTYKFWWEPPNADTKCSDADSEFMGNIFFIIFPLSALILLFCCFCGIAITKFFYERHFQKKKHYSMI